jgi:hypothetical protein
LGAEQTPDVDRIAVTSLLGGSDAGDERDAWFSGLRRACACRVGPFQRPTSVLPTAVRATEPEVIRLRHVRSIIVGRVASDPRESGVKERRVIVDPSGLVPTVRCARVSLAKQKRVFDRINLAVSPTAAALSGRSGAPEQRPNRGGSRVRQAGPPAPAGMALRLTCLGSWLALFEQVPYGEAMGETARLMWFAALITDRELSWRLIDQQFSDSRVTPSLH